MKTIDAKKVLSNLLGINITGYADGTYVTIEFPEDYVKMVGADGEVARIRQNDNTAVVKFALMQTSRSNVDLAKLRIVGKLTGADVGPCSVTDLSDGYSCAGAEAWIAKAPNRGWSKSGETREWEVHIAHAVETPGNA
jgi:hypothetical protein